MDYSKKTLEVWIADLEGIDRGVTSGDLAEALQYLLHHLDQDHASEPECGHGQLARSCELCEKDAEIERLLLEAKGAHDRHAREVERLRERDEQWQHLDQDHASEPRLSRIAVEETVKAKDAEIERLRERDEQWQHFAEIHMGGKPVFDGQSWTWEGTEEKALPRDFPRLGSDAAWFQSDVSGMWYEVDWAAGDVRKVRIDHIDFYPQPKEPRPFSPEDCAAFKHSAKMRFLEADWSGFPYDEAMRIVDLACAALQQPAPEED